MTTSHASYKDSAVLSTPVPLINKTISYNNISNVTTKADSLAQTNESDKISSNQVTSTQQKVASTLKPTNEPIISTNSGIKFLKYNTGDTIHLKCRIAKGPYLVLWNKLGLDYPLTIGKNRFIPDERFHVQYKPPNRWHLVIKNAQLNDTGVYSCTTGSGLGDSASSKDSSGNSHSSNKNENLESSVTRRRQSKMKITDDTAKRKLKGREYYVSVVEPLPSERYQVDVPISKTSMKNKTITVTGPNLVFYGTPLELICRASFPSSEAKLDPTISLEWYHRGIRRLSNPYKSGGVYITLRWLDSHLLESRLFIAWASEAEAGQWICLERSNPIKKGNLTQMSPNYHKLEYMELNSQSPAYLNKSVTYSPSRLDFVYDKIYIEIIVPTLSSSSSSSSLVIFITSTLIIIINFQS
uniref:Ig-like domain-containing protein n=1 Tax=Trichobilharzia regenti TaxID=157069 RepID=A0AA85J273_TRIRE|nr:unnamed protein product [Trichobilharzia regenti]